MPTTYRNFAAVVGNNFPEKKFSRWNLLVAMHNVSRIKYSITAKPFFEVKLNFGNA
jgi:hypothetical protein